MQRLLREGRHSNVQSSLKSVTDYMQLFKSASPPGSEVHAALDEHQSTYVSALLNCVHPLVGPLEESFLLQRTITMRYMMKRPFYYAIMYMCLRKVY